MTPSADVPGLTEVAVRWAGRAREDGAYRVPGEADGARVPAVVTSLLAPDPARLQAVGGALGLAPVEVTGWTVLASDPDDVRPWLLLAVRDGVVPDVLVQVPHPRADLRTEEIGAGVAERVPGALLLQAAAHRRVASPPGAATRDCPADVAHRPDSLFARVADGLVAARGIPQVQLHGFADRAGGPDVVVSGGATAPGPLVDAVARALVAVGERVGRGTDPGCVDLAGTRNVQGRCAARHGAPFVHLELSRALRRDPARRAAVAVAVAAAVGDVVGGARPYDRQP